MIKFRWFKKRGGEQMVPIMEEHERIYNASSYVRGCSLIFTHEYLFDSIIRCLSCEYIKMLEF